MIFMLLGHKSTSPNVQVFSPTSALLVSKLRKVCSSFEDLPDAAGDIDQPRWLAGSPRAVLTAFPPCQSSANSKSECVFSVAGNIVTPKRNRLAPQQV